ncbi:MAG: hypothetical protein R3E32_15865 [Chitinophagales bacterium]
MTPQERQSTFNAIDTNEDGRIGFLEWYKYFKKLVKETNMTKVQLNMIFQVYVSDSSPEITFEDYNSFMDDIFSLTVSTVSSEGRKKSFQMIDVEGNGVINFIEWYRHFKRLLIETGITVNELRTMFSTYDEKGISGGLNFEKYSSFMNDVFGTIK